MYLGTPNADCLGYYDNVYAMPHYWGLFSVCARSITSIIYDILCPCMNAYVFT